MATTVKTELDPQKRLIKQFGLDKSQRVDTILRGLAYMQLAIMIGSAVYFITSQTQLVWSYPKQGLTFFSLYLGDVWDRLPVHIENLLGTHWFGASQAAPAWWVTDRHEARHVLIGFIAITLIGGITVGMKKRKRASTRYMVMSVPIAFVVAMSVAAGLILFFNWATPGMSQFGVTTGSSYVEDLIGKGAPQQYAIGILAGVAAKLVLKRTFDTLQLMSLERKLDKGSTPRWWWKIVYTPTYRDRFNYLVASGHRAVKHNRVLGFALALSAPVLTFLAVFGGWLLYFGPAAHAG